MTQGHRANRHRYTVDSEKRVAKWIKAQLERRASPIWRVTTPETNPEERWSVQSQSLHHGHRDIGRPNETDTDNAPRCQCNTES